MTNTQATELIETVSMLQLQLPAEYEITCTINGKCGESNATTYVAIKIHKGNHYDPELAHEWQTGDTFTSFLESFYTRLKFSHFKQYLS